jgi:hypothetical protein
VEERNDLLNDLGDDQEEEDKDNGVVYDDDYEEQSTIPKTKRLLNSKCKIIIFVLSPFLNNF